MTKYEEFELNVLSVAPAEVAPNCHFGLSTTEEGAKRQIPEPHVREVLVGMCRREMIHMSIFDGQRECSVQEWVNRSQNLDSFFFNKTDSGRVRIRLLVAGVEQRERLASKKAIGFAAA